MADDEIGIKRTVPQASSLAAVWRELRAQGLKIDRLLRAVTKDELDPGAPDGLIQLQKAQGVHIQDLEARVTVIENDQKAAGIRQGDRFWTIAWDTVRTLGAALVGAAVGVLTAKGGPH